MYTSIWMVFLFLLPLTRLSVFLCCRIQLSQQSYFPCFLLHKTSVEYTRLYSSITEVLIYTVEPRIPCYDVFLSVGLLNRRCMSFVKTVYIIQSNSRHPLFTMNKSFTLTTQNMYLSSPYMLYSTTVL